jgi:hypothetical protein
MAGSRIFTAAADLMNYHLRVLKLDGGTLR